MIRKAWATLTYALALALTLLLLFLREPLPRLIVASLLLLNLASLLILLIREREWDGTHWLGFSYVLVAALFTLLFIGVTTTGVTYLYGAILVLASLTLLVVELVVDWRTYGFLDRLMHHPQQESDEIIIESVRPKVKTYGLATKRGAKTYHRDTCRLLNAKKGGEVIPLSSAEEAQSYGLKPCKSCKP